MLKSKAMADKVRKLQLTQESEFLSSNTKFRNNQREIEAEDLLVSSNFKESKIESNAVEYTAQHFSCSSCTSEQFSLNAPKFVFSSNNGVSTFNLPPMSSPEMSALSLFFSTSASFPCAVVFDHIPGFQITASVIDGCEVALLFHADHELIHFMGLEGSANLLNVTLGTSQLDMLAEQVLACAANCH
jgi:hypothetical protein